MCSQLCQCELDERRGGFRPHRAPYRRELPHTYRMTGSLHDAEDLFRDAAGPEGLRRALSAGKSSLRTRLHRIATHLPDGVEGRRRRPLPVGAQAAECRSVRELVERREVSWLEPLPDDDDPATLNDRREPKNRALAL